MKIWEFLPENAKFWEECKQCYLPNLQQIAVAAFASVFSMFERQLPQLCAQIHAVIELIQAGAKALLSLHFLPSGSFQPTVFPGVLKIIQALLRMPHVSPLECSSPLT